VLIVRLRSTGCTRCGVAGRFPTYRFFVGLRSRPEKHSEYFKNDHAELIRVASYDLIGHPLAFILTAPAYWLIDQHALTEEGPLDPELELARVTNLVIKLLAAKDDFVGHVRVLSHWTSL
jgi:hypothetical protein